MGRVPVSGSGAALRGANGVSLIAHPLAEEKLLKKTLKVVKKASKDKKVRRGVKEVQKALRKKKEGTRGIVVLAGDISPIDVISHLPVLCEESGIPYVYVPSKAELGSAGSTKRPTSCVMIVPGEDWEHAEAFNELMDRVKEVQPKF
jgi:H/ACA ribonucleoprotein complex subunit 2